MGNSIVKTPALDKLARQGTIFKNAYVTTSICCISRASIFSGQYAARHKILDFTTDFKDSAAKFNFPALMKLNGYYTGFIGKYGVGTQMRKKIIIIGKVFRGRVFIFIKMQMDNPCIVQI
jgi:arylsulfatase A-like enzyme